MRNTGPNALRHVSIILAGIFVAVVPLHVVRADADGAREQLARVIHELQALEPLLRAAQFQANLDTRVRIRYDWLRQDLQRMRLGIQEHINALRSQPLRAMESEVRARSG